MSNDVFYDRNPTDNRNLIKAKQNKNDEFYTLYDEVKVELDNYTNEFKDKTVYCNCDNPDISNFSKYFRDNFEKLGLKRLISTCYPHGIMEVIDYKGTRRFRLKGDGDFRSEECERILRNCDIVVTNPPFSLFIDFVNFISKHSKKFLIIGNKNAIQNKELVDRIVSGEIWNGFGSRKGKWWFICFERTEKGTYKEIDGVLHKTIPACWFTNFERPEMEITFDTGLCFKDGMSQGLYKTYDETDIINVNETKHIPMDYESVMGVPISFIDKFNPKQFELLGIIRPKINGKSIYTRLLIKKRK